MPTAAWESELARLAGAGSNQTGGGASTELADYTKLCHDMYKCFPGDNLSCRMPPVNSISLEHPRLLAFLRTCNIIEQAAAAVREMVKYKPHSEPGRPIRSAVFLLACNTSASCLPSLETYIIPRPSKELSYACNTDYSHNATSATPGTVGSVIAHDFGRLTGGTLDGFAGSDLFALIQRADGTVGKQHPVFGEQLAHAVDAATATSSLCLACHALRNVQFDHNGKIHRLTYCHVWVARW